MSEPLRIANCSGFFGDRPSAAREMVEGGPIDVLTGDWLAELTMLILHRLRTKQPGRGFAPTFVNQLEEVMGTCLERGVRVVSNAGGLDPEACADAVADVADRLGLGPAIAWVSGDDLLPRLAELEHTGALRPLAGDDIPDLGSMLSAHAYLGCWGIVEALSQGADIVITGRVTDAALTCGPAAWHHGWTADDLDPLAGAVVAGHVLECGAQATGGNYSFFDEIPGHTEIGGRARFGFPWADIAADGSSVIGKHGGTGGVVTIGTVTSQLLYEIGGPEYLGPDVTARFDTIDLEEIADDRVRISGVRGLPPPPTLKVVTNAHGGFRNSIDVALTGLDIEAKARFAGAAFWDACPHRPEEFASVTSRIVRTDVADASTQEAATARWTLTVKDPDEAKVGRSFADALVHTALAGIPGMYALGGSPTKATPYGVFRPLLVDRDVVPQYVHGRTSDGRTATVVVAGAPPTGQYDVHVDPEPLSTVSDFGPTRSVPVGTIVGARSGDKGGDANLGLFVRDDRAWPWLDREITIDRLRDLLPETRTLPIERHRFPNLRALNFVLHGFLEEGVAASTRQDPQAKALGEWFRSRFVDVPTALLP